MQRWRPPASRATTTSPASSTPTSCRRRAAHRLLGVPWYVDTRAALLSQRPAARRRPRAAAAELGRVAARDARSPAGAAAAAATARCCRSTSPIRCSRWRCSKARCSPTTTRRGAFSQPPFRRALDFYAGVFRDGLAPAMSEHARSPTSGTSSRAACSRSTSPGPGTSASSGVACRAERQGDWADGAAAGPGRAGRLDRRRLEPRHLQALAAQGGGLEADRVPQRARDDAALPRPHRRPAAAAQRLARSRRSPTDAPSQAFAQQLERVRAAPKIPEWERIFQEMQLTAERVVQGRQGVGRRLPRSSTPGSTRCSRSAAGCARAPRA